jgi:hypothetical protein
MIVTEFYSFVKSEPFSRYNVLFQDDGSGFGAGGRPAVQGGWP